MLRDEMEGRRSPNRPRWEGCTGRYWGKLMKKGNWYKKSGRKDKGSGEGGTEPRQGGRSSAERKERGSRQKAGELGREIGEEEDEAETVMFLPCTPRGELLKRVRETVHNEF